jgi:hypothetical protein
MPESVADRPTTATEYIFMLVHPDSNGSYYYDVEGVKEPHGFNRWSRNKKEDASVLGAVHKGQAGSSSLLRAGQDLNLFPEGGRRRRNSDWFFESLNDILAGQGVLMGGEGDPLAFVINPKPYPGAHFAVFPSTLVAPMITASTREGGVVLDPFSGSGTTGQVALKMGRNYVGVDLNPEYLDLAIARILDAPAPGKKEDGEPGDVFDLFGGGNDV